MFRRHFFVRGEHVSFPGSYVTEVEVQRAVSIGTSYSGKCLLLFRVNYGVFSTAVNFLLYQLYCFPTHVPSFRRIVRLGRSPESRVHPVPVEGRQCG